MAYVEVLENETLAEVVARAKPEWSVMAIREHARNARLFESRSPNALKTGDVIWIPDEPAARRSFKVYAGTSVTFVVSESRRPFSLLLTYPNGDVIKNKPYRLKIGELVTQGDTDADGKLTTQVPFDATDAVLSADGYSRKVVIGGLEPLHTARGIQARLLNLGYMPGPIDGVIGRRTMAAIKAFQEQEGLDVDGIVGPQTRKALRVAYGS